MTRFGRTRSPENDDPATPRPASRGWGPFTGRQLTAIVIALCVTVVLIPAAAFGVAKAKGVLIQDPVSTNNHAGVNAFGQLSVNASGSSVTARPAATSESFNKFVYFDGHINNEAVATPPAGKALVVTGLHYSFNRNSPGTVFYYLTRNSNGATVDEIVLAGLSGTENVTFPAGIVVKSGDRLNLGGGESVGQTVMLTITGYLVPAAECSTGATCGY